MANDWVTRAYQEAFGRAPDAEGANYWSSQNAPDYETLRRLIVDNADESDRARMAQRSTGSGLLQNAMSGPSEDRTNWTTNAYQTLFGREPEAEGAQYWSQRAGSAPDYGTFLNWMYSAADPTDRIAADQRASQVGGQSPAQPSPLSFAPTVISPPTLAGEDLTRAQFATQQLQAPGYSASNYQSADVMAGGYNAARADAQGYDATSAGSQGYGAALASARGYDASDARSQGYDPNAANLTNWIIDPSQTVEGRLQGLIERRSPLLQMAEANALQEMNRRGLVNSTMALGAGQQALYAAALPIAQTDAATFALAGRDNAAAANNMAQYNATARNQAAQFEAAAANQAALQNALARNQAAQFGAQADNTVSLANAAARNDASQFTAGAANTAALQNAAAANAASQFGAQAQNTASLANQASANQAAQFGAQAANTAALANQAAQNQAGQWNAGAANAANQFNAQLGFAAQQANADAVNRAVMQQYDAAVKASMVNADNATKIQLQQIDASTRTSLANIEAGYKTLMQSSASAADIYKQITQNISSIMENKDMDASYKQSAIDNQLQLLQNGMQVQGAISNLRLSSLLNFGDLSPISSGVSVPGAGSNVAGPAPGYGEVDSRTGTVWNGDRWVSQGEFYGGGGGGIVAPFEGAI